jgi:hypothetical protein
MALGGSVMAAAYPTAEDVWASLSASERAYLAILFDEDEKAGGPEGWRWLDLGGSARRWPRSTIQRRLRESGVAGTVRPVERLSGRGLLRTVLDSGRMLVRLTAAGRDAARTAVPARYRRRPPGLLSREAWRCLALIHAAGVTGWPVRLMKRRERRCFERHRLPLARVTQGSGDYFDLGARDWRALAAGEPVWTLTSAGRDHIDNHGATYRWLYPEVIAMDPGQPWECQAHAWRLAQEQFPDDIARALDQMEHVWTSAERAVRSAERGGQPSSGQWCYAVLGGLPIQVEGWGSWAPMRELEVELQRTVSTYWAALDSVRWRFASCFTLVATEVAQAAIAGVRPSLASVLPFVALRIGGSGRPLLLPRLATGDPEVDAGIARSRAVATADGATPEDLVELGRHVVELLRRARLVGPAPCSGHAVATAGQGSLRGDPAPTA